MSEHNFERLKAHIIPLSESKHFEMARQEWELFDVQISEEEDHCPCGQEIREHCFIRNRHNGNTTFVGNVCVNRFMLIDTSTLFEGLKRIRHNPSANANEALITYAQDSGFLYDGEYKFLMETRRKRAMSEKQLAWKRKINRRILMQTVVKRRLSDADALAALRKRVADAQAGIRRD